MDGSGSASSGFVARLTFAAFLPQNSPTERNRSSLGEITSHRFPQPHGREIFPALEIFAPDQPRIPAAPATGRQPTKFFGSTKGARPRRNVSLHGRIACEVQANLV